jgi:hypothetical protein
MIGRCPVALVEGSAGLSLWLIDRAALPRAATLRAAPISITEDLPMHIL